MSEPILRVDHVFRRFGRRIALDAVSLQMGAGEMVALVGPNGSGKTTLLKILAGFLRPDAGEVRLFGHDPWRDRPAAMRQTRFAFAPPPLYESLTAHEHLRALTRIGQPTDEAPGRDAIDQVLQQVGLGDRAHHRVREFSFGMRQRLALAQALLPLPKLLILDEPTDGLDPLGIQEFRDLIQRLRKEHGVAILLSSHLLVEVERLVDRVLLLHEGCPLYSGPVAEMTPGGSDWLLQVRDVDRAQATLAARGLTVIRDPDAADTLRLSAPDWTLHDVVDCLRPQGIELLQCHRPRPSLEQAFLRRLAPANDPSSGEAPLVSRPRASSS